MIEHAARVSVRHTVNATAIEVLLGDDPSLESAPGEPRPRDAEQVLEGGALDRHHREP
jgi:hypothetical protein